MTIRHHIADEILVSYASGSLPEAWSLLVATHLALCPSCRKAASDAEELGGALLEDLAPVDLSEDAFDKLMSKLESADPQEAPVAAKKQTADVPSVLPEPLKSYLGGDLHALNWKRLGKGAYHIPIALRNGGGIARLLKVPAGQPVPAHGHRGEELTLVLTGSFTTHQGEFLRGDVEAADDDIEHMPVAGPGEDCICLAITDAPLKFKSLGARLAQPFIGI